MASVDPDYDLVVEAYSAIWPRYERHGFAGLNDQERTIFCTWQFVCEVNNGGVHQFFFNPSGEFAKETVEALEKVEMPYAASLLKRALEAFPNLAKDHRTRAEQLLSLSECVQKDLFNELTGAFFDSPEDPYVLQAAYVRRNLASFPGL